MCVAENWVEDVRALGIYEMTNTLSLATKYDVSSARFFNIDYDRTFAEMRQADPVWWGPEIEAWLLTSEKAVRELCADRRFSTARVVDSLFRGASANVDGQSAIVRRFFFGLAELLRCAKARTLSKR